MRRVLGVVALLLGALVWQANAPGANATVTYGTNLIINGNAEGGAASAGCGQVAVPGWTLASGQATAVLYDGCAEIPQSAGPPDAGSNLFSGCCGGSAGGQLTQVIDVSSVAAAIDAGSVAYNLSGWLGGWDGQDDNATVSATFLGATSNQLGQATIGPVLSADRGGASGLRSRSVAAGLPAGTRTVMIALTFTRVAGSDDDGAADSLSFVLSLTTIATATSVSGAPNPSTFGQPLTVTAQVCAASGTTAPTGSVAFTEGTTTLGSSTLTGDAVPTSGACSGKHTATATIAVSGSQLAPGSHSIVATYTPATSAFTSSNGSYAQTVGCTQMVTGSPGSLTFTSGAVCIQNATVGGSVVVSGGASLFVDNSTINGGLRTSGANAVRICNSSLKGSASITDSSGFVLVGADQPSCGANAIASLVVSGNNGGMRIGGNTAGGSILVQNNHASGTDPVTLSAAGNVVRHNTIAGSLSCSGNTPPASNGGVANSVTGGRSGECAAPTF